MSTLFMSVIFETSKPRHVNIPELLCYTHIS